MHERKPVHIAGKDFEKPPIMVGAGPIKLPEHVKEVAESDADIIIVGSITVKERLGNPGTTYYADLNRKFSINSKGLPNPGLAYYKKHLPEMARIAHDYGKLLIVSEAGFSPEEYAHLAEAVMNSGADGQELNLGCPNVWGKDGKQKDIVSFNEDLTGETLRRVEQETGPDGWTTVKLSPFSNPSKLQAIASILSHSQLVKAVTTTNTFPNAFAFNQNFDRAIDPGDGLGGLGGEAMKEIGLGQVQQLRAALPSAIAVIGVGGISTARHMKEYARLGADTVQITTAYINFGPSIFAQVKGLL